jgi:UDP-N-acetylglucosamine 2-epimerase (non-hydrolysing)
MNTVVDVIAVVGTRPEAIKMAPVLKALKRRGIATELVGTGQHHDWQMLGSFLQAFDLSLDHRLTLANRDLLGSFISILSSLGESFVNRRPRLVLAQGDTTTVAAAAFAARKTGCAFGHLEAGLRAFSRELPEEEHRICADAVADLLFAPTLIARENLAREHVNGQVYLTGNTVLDALLMHPPKRVERREGILVTLHRQEMVDEPAKFAEALSALEVLARHHKVYWPIHPRAAAKIKEHGLAIPASVQISAPVGHNEFLNKLVAAKAVVTDSGGVQEEAAILGTPCIAVRTCTERPETLTAGVAILAGVGKQGIVDAADEVLRSWGAYARPVPHLYGDGRAGEKIAQACADYLGIATDTKESIEVEEIIRFGRYAIQTRPAARA